MNRNISFIDIHRKTSIVRRWQSLKARKIGLVGFRLILDDKV